MDQETTLFAGDRIRTGPAAYAKLTLPNGARIEVGSNSDLTVNRDGDKGVRVNLTAGTIGFTASKAPFTVSMNGQEIQSKSGARANIAMLPGSNLAEVKVLSGNVEAKNLNSKETSLIASGSERVVNLKTGTVEKSAVRVASLDPIAAPAGAPAVAPPPIVASAALLSMLVSAGAGVVGVAVMSTRPVVSTLSTSDILLKQQATTDSSNWLSTGSEAYAASTSISAAASAIGTASPSNASAANSITVQANSLASQISTLNAQLIQINQQLQSSTDSAQVAQLNDQALVLRNSLVLHLGTLRNLTLVLSNLQNVSGITILNVDQINNIIEIDVKPSVGSVSNPV